MSEIPDLKEKLLEKLKERGVTPLCELCQQNDWAVVETPVAIQISNRTGGLVIPQPHIPAAALVCNNCGNIRTLALGPLGLLSQSSSGDSGE